MNTETYSIDWFLQGEQLKRHVSEKVANDQSLPSAAFDRYKVFRCNQSSVVIMYRDVPFLLSFALGNLMPH